MGVKRVNVGSMFQPQEHGTAYDNDDWLSGLPDDVLVVILSCLPLREAARTSVLSSRWRNLWTYSSCLNFDADRDLDKHKKYYKVRNVERREYRNWVNSVLRSHKAPTLDEFRIYFDYQKPCSKTITKWLVFAFARRVQRLELSLLGLNTPYEFRAEFLGRSNRKAPSLTPFDFKFLKALRLRGVNVSGEDIDFFLRNCPLLEQLIVQGSYKMSDVEICGSSLALKHLEIFNCYPSSTIKISAPNLTSLKIGTLWGLLLENVPMLVEFHLIEGSNDLYRHKIFHVFHCCFSQLEILTVNLTYLKRFESLEVSELFPQMPKLKKFKAEICRYSEKENSLMGLTFFIRAIPHVQELEVEMMEIIAGREEEIEDGVKHFQNQHLKVLKLSGCFAGANEIEFVRHICANCVALEKIIVMVPHPNYKPSTREDIDGERNTTSYVKQCLEPHVPNHIHLLVL